MRGRPKRLSMDAPDLNLVPLLDMICLLIQMLLLNAQFGLYSQIESGGGRATEKAAFGLSFQVDVTTRGYDVRWVDQGAPKQRFIPCRKECLPEDYDAQALRRLATQLKAIAPDELGVVLQSDDDVPFDTMVRTMDALRSGPAPDYEPLFPDFSVGI